MSPAWRQAAAIAAGACLLLAAGLYSLRSGLRAGRGPRELAETREILRRVGGESGLAARRAQMAALVARLEQRRMAHAADAAAFSRRLEAAFAELGLELTASGDWKPVPNVKLPQAAAFERSFAGTGSFAALLDAVATLESWPDEGRVRSLRIGRQGEGRVFFTLEVTAIRTLPSSQSPQSSPSAPSPAREAR